MAKEIISCVLLVLSIAKLKLTTLFSIYILYTFKHQCFIHLLLISSTVSFITTDILSWDGMKNDESGSQTFAMLQNLLFIPWKAYPEVWDNRLSRPPMISPFSTEDERDCFGELTHSHSSSSVSFCFES